MIASETVDVAVLGDSSIVLGTRDGQQIRLCDDRLESVAPDQRQSYRDRLQQGSGYDDAHRQLLADLQRGELRARNRDDGYRVAEATGEAGRRATVGRFDIADLRWAVLATDRGATHHRSLGHALERRGCPGPPRATRTSAAADMEALPVKWAARVRPDVGASWLVRALWVRRGRGRWRHVVATRGQTDMRGLITA
ncbi:hypothetical protein [Pseudonocardia sp. EC080625-04]|uniref:hypothetical protein n=1 Tax=Pseudonocardia sp. EC080625-04 TaxID=1096868 RepID=UPI0009EC428A|nr:hypothetical protein [Pseudonocardia sp. EC080625-04]